MAKDKKLVKAITSREEAIVRAAKELGYDAGFGMNTYADNVASFVAQELDKRAPFDIIVDNSFVEKVLKKH
mgnify:CR=1 FL=1